MSDETWKAVEREIARLMDGKRAGPLGRRGRDIITPWPVSTEVKHRKRLPRWILKALEQAEQDATGNELPLAVFHELYQRNKASLVVMRLGNFRLLMRLLYDVMSTLKELHEWSNDENVTSYVYHRTRRYFENDA